MFDELGFVDVFRRLDPRPDRYTWWSNRGQAWANNVGWRIDYQIATPGIAAKAKAAAIYTNRRFSDHAPLLIDYDFDLDEEPYALRAARPLAGKTPSTVSDMLRVTDLVLARGTKRLLDGANLTVHAGHKVGLVGPNGCGKSSFFALILGEAHQDAGNVEFPPSWTIAHVAQETLADNDAGDRIRRGRRP